MYENKIAKALIANETIEKIILERYLFNAIPISNKFSLKKASKYTGTNYSRLFAFLKLDRARHYGVLQAKHNDGGDTYAQTNPLHNGQPFFIYENRKQCYQHQTAAVNERKENSPVHDSDQI